MKNGAPVLDASTLRTITVLGRAGQSLRSIERATGIRRERISKLLKQQGVRVRPPRFRRLPALAIMATLVPATGHALPVERAVAETPAAAAPDPAFGDWPEVQVEKDEPLPLASLRWVLPRILQAPEIRILRDHVAHQHDLEDAAKRCGIDRWVGRPVQDLAVLVVITNEIRDRLYFLESRRLR